MLRRLSDRFREAVTAELADSQYAPLVRTDARRPGPMGFVSGALDFLRKVRANLFGDVERLPLEQVSGRVAKTAKREMQRVVGIPAESLSTGLRVATWRRDNVGLITNMLAEQLDRVAELLNRYDNTNPFDLADQLQSEFSFTRARAELIARDQTLKLNGDITQDAHRQAGIEEYIWSTSKDSSVRDRHEDLEGTRQRWDDPPVINDRGETGHPGDDYQCRCVAVPILPELEG